VSTRRIGVLRVGSIGDHVIAVPVYRLLRARHAADSLTLISNIPGSSHPKLVGPASILPPELFDDIVAYPAVAGWRTVHAAATLFRRLQLDRLYYLMPKRTHRQLRRDAVALRLFLREIVGLSAAATEPPRAIGAGLYEHEGERLMRAAGFANDAAARLPERLSLGLSDAEYASAQRLAGDCSGAVVVSVGTKCDVKHWGQDNWRQLLRRLGELPAVSRLFLVGSADEYAECEEARRHWPRDAVNLCGRLSPRESAALMAQCRLFVGHDSGPMHLAAAAGAPVVAIFSSRSLPGVWYPMNSVHRTHFTRIDCMGCGRDRCEDRGKACITAITVDEVVASCKELLGQPRLTAEAILDPARRPSSDLRRDAAP
jgi:ADP-heptose:LPS heptosyltransferase